NEKIATGKDSTRWTRMANRWWQFRDYQPGTISAIADIPRYIACSRVTKRPIFEFVNNSIHPDSALTVFSFADDYSFGVLQSRFHWEWFKARCSTLKGDFRYTADTVFDTFPWPQDASVGSVEQIASAAVDLRTLRRKVTADNKWSLRDLYRSLETPGKNPLRDAHERLDAAVRTAYGMSAGADPLAFLLELNRSVADREATGLKVTAPGLPLSVDDPAPYITTDCIQI